MNEVMRRSACCLLSALLLCSCVGCANSVHEISEGDAAQSSSKNDDAAEQAYKAFTVDALDRIAADDLNNSDKLVLVNKLGAKSVHGDDAIPFAKKVDENNMYYVVSKYLCINGTPCVMEMLSKMNEGRWIDANGTRFLLDKSRGESRKLFLDPLTATYSRRYFETYLTHMEGMECVEIIDVNQFKQVNDTYGHPAGDVVLRDIAAGAVGMKNYISRQPLFCTQSFGEGSLD